MFAAISVLLFAASRVFAISDNLDLYVCNPVTDITLCNYTFGCYWDSSKTLCTAQEHYFQAAGTCAGTGLTFPDEYDYICHDDGTNYFIYDPTYYDSCSGEEYTSITETCPVTSSEGKTCTFLFVNSADTTGRCFECPAGSADPVCTGCVDDYVAGCRCANDAWAAGCYPNTTNAGMCDGRQVKGCSAIPFCNWNGSNCQPDWKCYYSYINGIYPNNVGGNAVCDNTSVTDGGAGCRNKTIDSVRYCTSDTITSTDEKCMKARADQATCEAEGCEWVPAGTGTRPFENWCTEIGSGASVARVSSVLMVLLSIMLTFL